MIRLSIQTNRNRYSGCRCNTFRILNNLRCDVFSHLPLCLPSAWRVSTGSACHGAAPRRSARPLPVRPVCAGIRPMCVRIVCRSRGVCAFPPPGSRRKGRTDSNLPGGRRCRPRPPTCRNTSNTTDVCGAPCRTACLDGYASSPPHPVDANAPNVVCWSSFCICLMVCVPVYRGFVGRVTGEKLTM